MLRIIGFLLFASFFSLKGQNVDFEYIQNLSEIIQANNEVGTFELGNLKIEIQNLTQYQNQLIHINKQ